MSEANKAVVRRLLDEVANKGNYDTADELVHPDFRGHSSAPGSEGGGVEAYKRSFMELRSAFPDLCIEIDQQLADGENVVTRWTAQATHTGGFLGIPPTGKRGAMSGINIDRVVDGKVVECWSNSDELGLLRQIGAIPEPAGKV